ncbi:uncharacterized protein LOC106780153 [Vigna radiata var. radiata]|uniref:Uncharacterized protein LOC106780153 n=1 Tax=Vigna radiata var. radiata TaxID=3916 RepID=A0A1S3W014_VIGRR|nr:uncharacterized protein LOC106780153 [Vigna radiata var. radiata]
MRIIQFSHSLTFLNLSFTLSVAFTSYTSALSVPHASALSVVSKAVVCRSWEALLHVERMARMIQSNLPIFDGKNFEDWCVKMDVILGFQEIDEIVKIGFKEPAKNATDEEKKAYKENRKLDCKARMILHQCISATIFQKGSKATIAKETWEILQDGYGTAGNIKEIKLQSLRRQYELLNMGEQETIGEYIGRIQVIVNTMRACEKVVKHKKIVHKILRTLTSQYVHIVVAIVESRDLEKMKVEELQNSLEAHEQRLLERKTAEKDATQNVNQALQAKIQKGRGFGRGQGRTRGDRGGRNGGRFSNNSEQIKEENHNDQREGSYGGRGKPRGRGGRKSIDKRNVQCFTCSKFGHYSSECWHNESNKKTKNDEAANLAQETCDSESEHVVLMCVSEQNKEKKVNIREVRDRCRCKEGHMLQPEETQHAESRLSNFEHALQPEKESCATKNIEVERVIMSSLHNHTENDSCWYLDTGCSNHMTERKEWMVSLDLKKKSTIRFADDSTVMAEGVGRILINCKNGGITYMDDVLYIPTMKSNLLSLGQLLEKGYTMHMHKNLIDVFDKKKRMIFKASLAKNRTFKVNLSAVAIQCLSSLNVEEESWAWHYRYGHLNFRSLG